MLGDSSWGFLLWRPNDTLAELPLCDYAIVRVDDDYSLSPACLTTYIGYVMAKPSRGFSEVYPRAFTLLD
jgi:hypothetical protein